VPQALSKSRAESADRRLLDLQRELSDAEDRLKRLYRSIEERIVELDDILRGRTATLKSQQERAKAALDHARAQCGTAAAIDVGKIDAFARLMNEKLDTADINTRMGYIHSIIDAIEVDDKAIRIVGSEDILQAAIAGRQTENGNVRGFVRKWRARNGFEPPTLRFVAKARFCREDVYPLLSMNSNDTAARSRIWAIAIPDSRDPSQRLDRDGE